MLGPPIIQQLQLHSSVRKSRKDLLESTVLQIFENLEKSKNLPWLPIALREIIEEGLENVEKCLLDGYMELREKADFYVMPICWAIPSTDSSTDLLKSVLRAAFKTYLHKDKFSSLCFLVGHIGANFRRQAVKMILEVIEMKYMDGYEDILQIVASILGILHDKAKEEEVMVLNQYNEKVQKGEEEMIKLNLHRAFVIHLNLEKKYLVAEGYAGSKERTIVREQVVEKILEFSAYMDSRISETPDEYLPFMAINYFDRFNSRKDVNLHQIFAGGEELSKEDEQIRILLPICCLILSWKMNHSHFKAKDFLDYWSIFENNEVLFSSELEHIDKWEAREEAYEIFQYTFQRVEIALLRGLNYEARDFSAFNFLPMFVHEIPMLKNVSQELVHDIIFKAGHDINFTKFKPSVIAASALLVGFRSQDSIDYETCKHGVLGLELLNEEELEVCIKGTLELLESLGGKEGKTSHLGEASQHGETSHLGEMSQHGETSHLGEISQPGETSHTGGRTHLGETFTFHTGESSTMNLLNNRYEGVKIMSGCQFCLDKITGDAVVVKSYSNPKADGITTTMLREVSLLKDLQHDNIIRIRDVFCLGNNVHYVMDALDMDLSKYIQEHQLDSRLRKVFLYQILKGISYLHYNNIIHRDLKPQNVLVDVKNEIVKISDFGLARQVGPHFEKYTILVGTLGYFPPESLLAIDRYSKARDIWCIGYIFYEMVKKEPLVQQGAEMDCYIRHLSYFRDLTLEGLSGDDGHYCNLKLMMRDWVKSWKSLLEEIPNLEPEGVDLLLRMLQVNPEERITCDGALIHPYFNDIQELRGSF